MEPRSLQELLASQRRLPPDRAVWIGLGICAALSRLHRRGAIHGGLQLKTVRLGPEDQVELIPGSTSDGESVGSVRDDLYALGLTLHKLFAGTPQLEEIARRVMEQDSPRCFHTAGQVAWALTQVGTISEEGGMVSAVSHPAVK